MLGKCDSVSQFSHLVKNHLKAAFKLFCKLNDFFFFEHWCFHHQFPMQYSKMCIYIWRAMGTQPHTHSPGRLWCCSHISSWVKRNLDQPRSNPPLLLLYKCPAGPHTLSSFFSVMSNLQPLIPSTDLDGYSKWGAKQHKSQALFPSTFHLSLSIRMSDGRFVLTRWHVLSHTRTRPIKHTLVYILVQNFWSAVDKFYTSLLTCLSKSCNHIFNYQKKAGVDE